SPIRFAQTIALDLANLLDRDPQADLVQYVHDQYAQYNHPFFVVLGDGRVIASGNQKIPDPLLTIARGQLQRWNERPPMRWFDRGDSPRFGRPPSTEPPDGSDGPGRGGPPFFGRGERFERGPNGERFERGPGGERFERGAGERLERGPGGVPFVRPVPIVVAGHVSGVVVVPPQAPFGFLLGRYGPMLTLVAGVVLIVGTIVTTALVFGP